MDSSATRLKAGQRIGVVLALVCVAANAAEPAFETEPMLDAAAIVQPALLSAPNATVAPQASVHGYMARFELDTPFGPLAAESVELLAIRQAEIPAVEALERASRSGAFAHALGEKFRKTGKSVWQVVTHPVATVAGLPAGVARYFRKQVQRWSGRAQSVGDRAAREFGADGDPFRSTQAPMSSARAPLPGDENALPPDKPWYGSIGKEVGREAKRQLDYNKMRRQIARHLGVDPSSSNPLLRERLDTLAWAAVAGNFSAGAALDAVGGSAAEVMSAGGRLNELVWELDEDNLRERNRQRLSRWCSDAFALRQFLRRGGFNDSLRTALADELDALEPVRGCNDLIEIGAGTRTELEARYLVNALRLIRSQKVRRGELFVVGAALAWRDGERLLLPLPLDWLSWTAEIGEFFAAPQFRIEDKSVLVGGEISTTAQRALAARGWSMQVRVAYAGAPAYADDISQGLPLPQQVPPPQLCVGDVAETAACL